MRYLITLIVIFSIHFANAQVKDILFDHVQLVRAHGCNYLSCASYKDWTVVSNKISNENIIRIQFYKKTNNIWKLFSQFSYPGRDATVSIDKNTAAVGINNQIEKNKSTAIFFTFNNENWVEEKSIVIGHDKSNFGNSISIHNNWVFIGAKADDAFGENTGSVYTFKKTDKWKFHQKVMAKDPVEFNYFGHEVAASKHYIAISAYSEREDCSHNGKVYLFQLDSNGYWKQNQLLEMRGGKKFGKSLAGNNDFFLVGEPAVDHGKGMVHVFYMAQESWVQYEELKSLYSKGFGAKTEIHDNKLIVEDQTGKIEIYTQDNNRWVKQKSAQVPSNMVAGDLSSNIGTSASHYDLVSIHGDLLYFFSTSVRQIAVN